tara:strand:- start:21729 stop:22097 length:369 start_codon:yes stop_codon:yes gene_type:complete
MAKLTNTSNFNNAAFGQYGSTYSNTIGESVQPPAGRVIVAITFLEDLKLDELTAEHEATRVNNDISFNHTNEGAALAAANGEPIGTGTTFPKGLTIYGRWTAVSLQTAGTTAGIICYFAPEH